MMNGFNKWSLHKIISFLKINISVISVGTNCLGLLHEFPHENSCTKHGVLERIMFSSTKLYEGVDTSLLEPIPWP